MQYTRLVLLSIVCGLLSGAAATLFLHILDWATTTRNAHTELLYGLPIAGFIIGWTYHTFGKAIVSGNNLILDEIHSPKNNLPLHMAPFILIGTLLTHIFGGSAGREGAAIQMAASLTDQVSKIAKVSPDERKHLLIAGAGAGFGAALGTPIAGILFGIEVLHVGRIRPIAWLDCAIASLTAYGITLLLKAPHTHYPILTIPLITLKAAMYTAIAGIFFGLAVKTFCALTHIIERLMHQIHYPPIRPVIGGLILIATFHLVGTMAYAGLGIPIIQEALQNHVSLAVPILKTLFTTITLGTGFKGGEFVPLVFIGTTLGSALSSILPIPTFVLAASGFAAVFAGAANTPIACTLMACEIFGYKIIPYALIACITSYIISGQHKIYASQQKR